MSMDAVSLIRQGSYQNQISIEKIVEVVMVPLYRVPLPQYPSYYDITTNSRIMLTEIEDYPTYLKNISGHKKSIREVYGTLHCARVTLWSQLLIGLYHYKGIDTSQLDPVLLACAAMFCDVARENEVDNYWSAESADLLTLFFEKNDIESNVIEMYGQAVRETSPRLEDYKTLLQRIIHDANCLDMFRSPASFDPQKFFFYQLKKGLDNTFDAFLADVKQFIANTESLKMKLEADANPYQAVLSYLNENAAEYPHMIKLLDSGFKAYLNNIDLH